VSLVLPLPHGKGRAEHRPLTMSRSPRRRIVDSAAVITRHYRRRRDRPAAADDGAEDADRARPPARRAPAERSVAALRSARAQEVDLPAPAARPPTDRRRIPPAPGRHNDTSWRQFPDHLVRQPTHELVRGQPQRRSRVPVSGSAGPTARRSARQSQLRGVVVVPHMQI